MLKKPLIFIFAVLVLSGCITKKKYNREIQKHIASYDSLKVSWDHVNADLALCLSDREAQNAKIKSLQDELANAKEKSGILLNQLKSLSVITEAQAESIKKSLENINAKESYIKGLQSELARKDSLNMVLVLNLKGALQDVNDEDVTIKVEGSAVFISVSDKLLFSSGSYDITPKAKVVLGKVAAVLKAQPEIQFMVEGHTDNKPIKTAHIKDNWDLSVLRATSVVRLLQKDFNLEPARMIAAGRSEYVPVKSNDTNDDRAANRRTRIVIIPQLDQFFQLLTPKN